MKFLNSMRARWRPLLFALVLAAALLVLTPSELGPSVIGAGAYYWCCCCRKPGPGKVTWRRYSTGSPPAVVRYWDAGNACEPFAVTPGDGTVYTAFGNGPGSHPLYLTGWPNSGSSPVVAPTWFDQLATQPTLTACYVSGSKVLYVGTFLFQTAPFRSAVTTDTAGNILSYDASAFGPIPPSPTLPTGNHLLLDLNGSSDGLQCAYTDGSFGGADDAMFSRYDVGVALGISAKYAGPGTFTVNWNGGQSAPLAYAAVGNITITTQAAIAAGGLPGPLVLDPYANQDGDFGGYYLFIKSQDLAGVTGWATAANGTFSVQNSVTDGANVSCTYARLSRWNYPRFTQATLHNAVNGVLTALTTGSQAAGVFSDAAGTLDLKFATTTIAGGVPVQCFFQGFLQPDAATLTVYAKNVSSGAWDTIGTITGSTGSATAPASAQNASQLFPLTAQHLNSFNEVQLRFYGTGLPSPATFFLNNTTVPVQYSISGPAIDTGPFGTAATDGDRTYISGNNRQLIRLAHDGSRDYLYEVPLAPQEWQASPAKFLVVDPSSGAPYVGGDYVAFQAPG